MLLTINCIVEIVKQCVENRIIKDTEISIDTTHTQVNTFKSTPERVMKYLAKKIFKTYEKETGVLPEHVDQSIPNYKEISDNKEAKKVMENYLQTKIEKVEDIINVQENPETYKVIENAKQILKDPKFIEQKGVRSIVDQDARVGHKSKTDNFFGYKTEYMITTNERIITAISVDNGAYVDGRKFDELIELTQKTGLDIKEVYGDKAYFKNPILDKIKEVEATPYITESEMAYKIDEERFSYNKESDEWFCNQGNATVRKVHRKDKSGKETYKYYFEKEKCKNCPQRQDCVKGTSKARVLEIGINTPEFYGYSQQQKTEEFKAKYKKRACQEWKNGEMKNFHGLGRANVFVN